MSLVLSIGDDEPDSGVFGTQFLRLLRSEVGSRQQDGVCRTTSLLLKAVQAGNGRFR